MKVLQIHNFYQQPGGEDQVYAAECDLLKQHGDVVEQYSVHNDAIGGKPGLNVALETIWNQRSYHEVRELIERFRPDVVHCHNTFPIVSPSVYYAAYAARVPVAQTVQNYRLICPKATLLREGKVCEDCVGHLVPYSGIVHSCYRENRLASATVASMLTAHRIAGTWNKKVQRYIAPTDFLRRKLVEGGLPAERIAVKPNFLSVDPGTGAGDGGYALFVGRLSPEKGLATLVRGWHSLPDLPLKIVGDGPLREFVTNAAAQLPNVTVLGFRERPEVLRLVKAAAVLVVPSEWYEGFPMTVVEAFACGTPVVASDLGSLHEVVEEGVNGLRFAVRSAEALGAQVKKLVSQPSIRNQVRQSYLAKYSAEQNYPQLDQIYRNLKESRRSS